jgi:hypothetical protein
MFGNRVWEKIEIREREMEASYPFQRKGWVIVGL